MSRSAFISYSHLDEPHLERLHTHLAVLRREGSIQTWFDREIGAGGEVDKEINVALNKADFFLALVSPDFLSSNYCYEIEMLRALERHAEGTLKVVPIIVEPCDRLASPLAKLKALPKDGKAVSLWENRNHAYSNIVSEVRRLLSTEKVAPKIIAEELKAEREAAFPLPRQYRVKKTFDIIDKRKFADQAYKELKGIFERSVKEINDADINIHASFDEIDSRSFTCTVVNRSRKGSNSSITMRRNQSGSGGDIIVNYEAFAKESSFNNWYVVEETEFDLFLKPGNSFYTTRKKTDDQSIKAIGDHEWNHVVERAGIEWL